MPYLVVSVVVFLGVGFAATQDRVEAVDDRQGGTQQHQGGSQARLALSHTGDLQVTL